jgi:hypothetical protein
MKKSKSLFCFLSGDGVVKEAKKSSNYITFLVTFSGFFKVSKKFSVRSEGLVNSSTAVNA